MAYESCRADDFHYSALAQRHNFGGLDPALGGPWVVHYNPSPKGLVMVVPNGGSSFVRGSKSLPPCQPRFNPLFTSSLPHLTGQSHPWTNTSVGGNF